MTATTDTLTAPTAAACPADLPWCNDVCLTDGDGAHHSSGFSSINIHHGRRGETTLSMSVYRTDQDDQPGPVQIFLGADSLCDEMTLTAERARRLAALLLNHADLADPLPYGQMHLGAQLVRLGDEILTPDGWQSVAGQMAFSDNGQVAIWTDEGSPDADGWPFSLGDLVRVRRRIHGSCAITFEEPQP